MFVAAQITIILFAILNAPEEVAWSWPFRSLSTLAFPQPDKDRESKPAHKYGAYSVIVVCVGLAFLSTFNFHVKPISIKAVVLFVSLLLLLLLEYWAFFDPFYSVLIGRKWYYIGNTAKTDIALNSLKIKKVGIYKSALCFILIGVINYVIFNFFLK